MTGFRIKCSSMESQSNTNEILLTTVLVKYRRAQCLTLLAPISQMVKHAQTIRQQLPTNC